MTFGASLAQAVAASGVPGVISDTTVFSPGDHESKVQWPVDHGRDQLKLTQARDVAHTLVLARRERDKAVDDDLDPRFRDVLDECCETVEKRRLVSGGSSAQ